jgi:hypothetical protein
MKEKISSDHPLRVYFAEAVHEAFDSRLGIHESDVEDYLTSMMIAFLHLDEIYGIKNKEGQPVTAISDMVVEGDIRMNADSFLREREVHRHIGDFLLFWSGLFPEHLQYIKSPAGPDALLDPVGQGRMSPAPLSTTPTAKKPRPSRNSATTLSLINTVSASSAQDLKDFVSRAGRSDLTAKVFDVRKRLD